MRASSECMIRMNHHSLNKKEAPFSLHASKNDSMYKLKKMSTASLKENMPDLERLMMDIKISPGEKIECKYITAIMDSLKELQANSSISDEVHAVRLLMKSIEKKINSHKSAMPSRSKMSKPFLRSSIPSPCPSPGPSISPTPLYEVSPIKQICDEASSRILYTNFSIKDIQKSISGENSIQSSHKNSVKITVSKFEEVEDNSEVERLNSEIKYLEQLLKKKSDVGSTALFKKKGGNKF